MSYAFINGITVAGYLVGALFFARFWRRTGEAVFGWFCLAFVVLALQPTLQAVLTLPTEDTGALFLIRLAGFLLIAVGIIAANRSRKT
jgi:hypothetical protein